MHIKLTLKAWYKLLPVQPPYNAHFFATARLLCPMVAVVDRYVLNGKGV